MNFLLTKLSFDVYWIWGIIESMRSKLILFNFIKYEAAFIRRVLSWSFNQSRQNPKLGEPTSSYLGLIFWVLDNYIIIISVIHLWENWWFFQCKTVVNFSSSCFNLIRIYKVAKHISSRIFKKVYIIFIFMSHLIHKKYNFFRSRKFISYWIYH